MFENITKNIKGLITILVLVLFLTTFTTGLVLAGRKNGEQTGYIPITTRSERRTMYFETARNNSTIVNFENGIKLVVAWYNVDINIMETYYNIQDHDAGGQGDWNDELFAKRVYQAAADHGARPNYGSDRDLDHNPIRHDNLVFMFGVINPDHNYIPGLAQNFFFKNVTIDYSRPDNDYTHTFKPISVASFSGTTKGGLFYTRYVKSYRELANEPDNLVQIDCLFFDKYEMTQMFKDMEEGRIDNEITFNIKDFNGKDKIEVSLPLDQANPKLEKARDIIQDMVGQKEATINGKAGRQYFWPNRYRKIFAEK